MCYIESDQEYFATDSDSERWYEEMEYLQYLEDIERFDEYNFHQHYDCFDQDVSHDHIHWWL